MKCPCQGCEPPKRTITCHIAGNCKEHDEWKEYIQQCNENRKKQKTCKDLLDTLSAFHGKAEQNDDIAIMCIKL